MCRRGSSKLGPELTWFKIKDERSLTCVKAFPVKLIEILWGQLKFFCFSIIFFLKIPHVCFSLCRCEDDGRKLDIGFLLQTQMCLGTCFWDQPEGTANQERSGRQRTLWGHFDSRALKVDSCHFLSIHTVILNFCSPKLTDRGEKKNHTADCGIIRNSARLLKTNSFPSSGLELGELCVKPPQVCFCFFSRTN